jgi:hypothetical protein
MREPSPPRKAGIQWIWVAVLLGLLILVIVWFSDPLGSIAGSPAADPTANPTEWTIEPTGPAVDVKLPETPLKNSPAKLDEALKK